MSGFEEEKKDTRYEELVNRLQRLESENLQLKRQTKIVGVRWYGYGGIGISLTTEINGARRVEMQGYGSKAVIDYASWLKAKNWDVVKDGILVRDDTVVEELSILGTVAPEDTLANPNSFTDKELDRLITDSINGKSDKSIKQRIKEITSHSVVHRFIDYIKKLKTDKARDLESFLWKHYKFLETTYRYIKLDKWDVIAACETANISVQGIDKSNDPLVLEDLRKKLVLRELKILDET